MDPFDGIHSVFLAELNERQNELLPETISENPSLEAFAKACTEILCDSGALVDEPEFLMIDQDGIRLDAICWPNEEQPIIEFLAFLKTQQDFLIEKEITKALEKTLPIMRRLCKPTGSALSKDIERIVKQILVATPQPESIILRIVTDSIVQKTLLEKKLRNSLRKKLPNQIHTDFKLCDLKELYLISGGGQIGPAREFPTEGHLSVKCFLAHEELDHDVYLAAIPGQIISDIFKEYGQQLLQKNVRAFLGMRGKKNQKISKTLRERPQKFFAFNNGLTITASSVELNSEKNILLKLEDIQIVNGGQTTAILANEYRNNIQYCMDSVKIFAKIIHVKNHEQHQDWIEIIAETSNTQNAIKDADLSSHNPVFVKIKELSQKIIFRRGPETIQWYFNRVRNEYKVQTDLEKKKGHIARKVFETKYPKERVFEKKHVARAENVFSLRPWFASQGEAKSHNAFLSSLPDNFLPEENWYKLLVGKIVILKKAEEIAKSIGIKEGRSCIVEYGCALVTLEPSFSNQLTSVYKSQKTSIDLENQIKKKIQFVWSFFQNLDKNRSTKEHAKKEVTWLELKRIYQMTD